MGSSGAAPRPTLRRTTSTRSVPARMASSYTLLFERLGSVKFYVCLMSIKALIKKLLNIFFIQNSEFSIFNML